MSELPIVRAYGYDRKMGCLPRTLTSAGDGVYPVYGDNPDDVLLTWDEIKAAAKPSLAAMKANIWHWINQKDQGSCCACMGAQLLMLTRKLLRLDDVVISQASIYAQGNGGRDAGMAIDTCMDILLKTGACPTDVIDQYDWQGFHRNSWPSVWRTTAPRYKAARAVDAPTLQHALSMTVRGIPAGFGYFEGGGGHAVTMLGYDIETDEVISQGSWGKGYGSDNGRHHHRRSVAEEGIKYFGAFGLYVPTDPTNDGDIPQPH